MFFRNAPSDQGCIKKTAAEHRKKFGNPVHNTLPIARKAWPSLGGYKLGGLAEHVGAPVPAHRALALRRRPWPFCLRQERSCGSSRAV